MNDGFEVANGFNPLAGGEEVADSDFDGLNNLAEQTAGTNPNDGDSDDDGSTDGAEVASGSNPTDPGRYPVVIDFAQLIDPGNTADVTGFGAVADIVGAAKREVTVRQYVSFLNAVAHTDTFGLYASNPGIQQTGSAGSYVYYVVAGQEEHPVTFVSFYDALRFINWLENDQPDGPQDATTTEDGAYSITSAGILSNSIIRRPDARFALPTEDEWYKAAYYNVGSDDYLAFPASEASVIICATPGATPNTANCDNAVGDVTNVGTYTGSASPNGTFDQGGNVWEWTESIMGADRRIRGGSYASPESDLAAANSGRDADPFAEDSDIGFRVPEPGGSWPLAAGIGALMALRRHPRLSRTVRQRT